MRNSPSPVREMSVFDDFERGGQWAVPGFGGMVPGRLVHGKNGTEMHAMYSAGYDQLRPPGG